LHEHTHILITDGLPLPLDDSNGQRRRRRRRCGCPETPRTATKGTRR
jgi:hypothetical protein